MCGLLSIFSQIGSPVCVDKLRKGLDCLHHRGPDRCGYWLSRKNDVALGHTRLSIIDLDHGDQPISNQSESLHIVVNGEFYDFDRIRQSLENKGYKFKTRSDSEIALHLYDEYGVGCFEYLRGEFAFNLWDERNQLFIAARDRFGIKPLYYTVHENRLYVASEIKALIAAGVPAAWDEESYLTRAFFFRDRSLFNNIHQVPPGFYLIATRSGHRLCKYWDIDYPQKNDYAEISEADAVEIVSVSLHEAIRKRLRADVPLAVYLSGGIDSGAVLGIAAEQHHQSIDAFTLSFSDSQYDESVIARKTAAHAGANYHEIQVGADDLADNFSQTVWHSESICFNSHSIAKFLLSKAVSDRGFKVVLTGEGADEIFGGYAAFRQDMILYNTEGQDKRYIANYLNQLKRTNQNTAGLLTPVGRPDNIEFLQKQLGFEPTYLLPLAESIDTLKTLYNKQALDLLGNSHPIQQFFAHTEKLLHLKEIEPVHAAMYLLSKSALPNYVLINLGDRMEMAHSLEGRVPFLDHHLVEQVIKLPINFKIRGNIEKYVLREAVKPYLLEEVYLREKQPFLAPPSTAQKNQKLHTLIQDTLRGSLIESVPFIDKGKLLNYLDAGHKGKQITHVSQDSLLMELTSLCFIQQHYMQGL